MLRKSQKPNDKILDQNIIYSPKITLIQKIKVKTFDLNSPNALSENQVYNTMFRLYYKVDLSDVWFKASDKRSRWPGRTSNNVQAHVNCYVA